jgi:hypothetical protein
MQKKLRLARITIAHLTMNQLEHVVGGVQTDTSAAGQQSMKIGTVVEPCQVIPGSRTRGDVNPTMP